MSRTAKLKDSGRDRPLAVWKEDDSIDGEKVRALVIILDGPGCSWSKKVGCTMCGYCNDVRSGEVTEKDLMIQAKQAMERYEGEPYIKIFTSGSFLDPDEIPFSVQKGIVEYIGKKTKNVRLLVESRPEYVTGDSLETLTQEVKKLEVAMGLETSSDEIRARYIRKGFSWKDYLKAGNTVTDVGGYLKTYLLHKPPLIGEEEAIDDAVRSIEDVHTAFPGSRVSINPMNIQSSTVVERLYRRGMYRPPWLWSLVEVLRRGYSICGGETHLMSSPTGGGKRRGAHNCGKCDMEILSCINRFSIDNDPSILPDTEGCCSARWKMYISVDDLVPAPLRII